MKALRTERRCNTPGREGALWSHPAPQCAGTCDLPPLVFSSAKWAPGCPFHREPQRLNDLIHENRVEEIPGNHTRSANVI